MYKEKIQVTSNDVDQNLELKLSSLFKFLQEVASNQADSVHAGHWDLFKHNMLWVVLRMDVQIYRTPLLDEMLTVGTHPGEMKSFIYPRLFEVRDSKNNVIIKASSIWTIIDKNTRRVVLKPGELFLVKGSSEKDDLPLPMKVDGKASNLIYQRLVRYSDIDLNGHLNNTQYVSFILDSHDDEFYKHHRPKRIEICYDKEIRMGALVDIYSDNNNPEVIRGDVNGVNHFSAKIEYEER